MGEEYKRVEFQYGVVMLRTKRFQGIMDSLGRRRISKPVAWFLLYLMPVAGGIALYLFLTQLGILLSPRGAEVASYVRTLSPLGNLGLPGINPYLPIVDGWIALFAAIIVHEGAHGVVARSLGLPVKSSGLLFFLIVPIGAFVEVDEDALKVARAADSGRVLAAGAGINLVVGIVCLLLLFGVVSAMRPSVNGIAVVGVYGNTTAGGAGIMVGDFITQINGVAVNDPVVVSQSPWYQPGQVINLTVVRDGRAIQFTNLTLGTLVLNNTQTGKVTQTAFLGVSDVGYQGLQGLVSSYTNSFFKTPALYICIPTLPSCQGIVPFSDSLSRFYSSSFGQSLAPLANLLYWLFFLNFNLSIFNSLPIYPLDGGQAFRVAVKALGGEKLGEKSLSRVTSVTSIVVVAILLSVIVGPYLL
ncbi:MAG: site-2 protease family protein [Nitrososphaerales archaeon]|nr:site-2 protease family protein [Nitrososphaerales archaeon]